MKDLRARIYADIDNERNRQDEKFGWIGEPKSLLPGPNMFARLAVLMEEVGEVANALLEGEDIERIHEELIQVAACAVAWVEADRTRAQKYTWTTVPIGHDVPGSGIITEKCISVTGQNIYITFSRYTPFAETWIAGHDVDGRVPIAICSRGLVYE